jgi:hypothetical protein
MFNFKLSAGGLNLDFGFWTARGAASFWLSIRDNSTLARYWPNNGTRCVRREEGKGEKRERARQQGSGVGEEGMMRMNAIGQRS